MKNLISARLAGHVLLAAVGLLLVFHILVLFGVFPPDIVWGGMVQDVQANMVTLEIIAILVTLLFLALVAAKLGYLRANRWSGLVNAGVWLIFGFLLLNTIGNLASGVSFERLFAAPMTILLALCALRLAIEKR